MQRVSSRSSIPSPAALASLALAAAVLLLAAGCHGNASGKSKMADLYRSRAILELQNGDTAGAGRFLSKAEDLEPDSADTQILIGEVLRREGNLDPAEARYRKAIEIDSNSPEAHLHLGVLLGMKGRTDEALREFQVTARSGQFANRDLAYANIGQIHLDRKELVEAEQALRTAIAINDEWPGTQANLGRVLYQKGDYPAAAERFARTLQLDPNFVEARYHLALAYVRLGRKADAIAELRNVLRIDPSGTYSSDAREQLALLE